MTYDQAQSPRLGQRTPIESTYVRMFSGGEVPEAAWPGQIIYINEEQILQIYNGSAWEDVAGGTVGQLTFVGPDVPVAQAVGDVWFNTADGNRMYVAKSAGADQIATGEWEVISGGIPPITATTYIYRQDTPPTAATSSPVPKENDFWYETPDNHQYYYMGTAPGNHWVFVQDTGIPKSITTSVTEYSVNSSETIAPTTGWSTTTPTRAPGTFVWFRTTTTRNNGTSATTNPALLTGNTGAPGPAGSQGIPGPPGPEGQALYTWVKYADTPTTGMSDSPTNKQYLGLAYNKTTATESGTYADYSWSLIQGENGDPGVPGPPGADGQPTYTWIKYGTDANGAGLSDSSVGKTHIGIAYNKTTAVESTTPTDYEWSLIQGPPGATGVSITLVTPYFAKVTTGAAAPTKPTQATPIAPWVNAEPAYTANTELYRTEKNLFSDATYSYTNVSKVSSYTAATDAMVVANSKTKSFYQTTPPTATTVGDMWYKTDDDNAPYFASVVGANAIAVSPTNGWWLVKDPNIDMINPLNAEVEANKGGIEDLNTSVEANAAGVTDAKNTAETADGRVSMSDYEPGKDDVAGRNQGSIWFTRTRPRANLCTNPSFEVNTTDWSGGLCSGSRITATPAIDGGYILQVTNTATVGDHYESWYQSTRVPCVEGQTFTWSGYVKYVSGVGLGVHARLLWYNTTPAHFSTSTGTAYAIIPPVTVPATPPEWIRVWVTGSAPVGATSFFPRIVSPSGNENDVWQLDACLLEQDDDLGRYFDGDSFDGSWEDPAKPNNSGSILEGNKILRAYELLEEDWNRKYFTEDTIAGLDAVKLTGTLDGLIIGDNTIAPDKMIAAQVLTSESVQAGDLVHIWNSSGNFRARKADALAGYEAHGFVLDSAGAGVFVPVFHQGYNPFMLNLVPGVQFLAAAGQVTGQPPWAVGQIAQRVGFAPTTSVLNFSPMQPIKII